MSLQANLQLEAKDYNRNNNTNALLAKLDHMNKDTGRINVKSCMQQS